jgi:hypothetical protein
MMTNEITRLLRLRWDDHREPTSAAPAPGRSLARALAVKSAPRGTPRFLGQVTTAGTIPQGTNCVYLVNPVQCDSVEGEGASPSLSVDATRSIPVVVVGSTPPQKGNLLVAFAVGGRWVAESSVRPPSLLCSPCSIPRKTLTVSWTNSMLGNRSVPLVYRPPGMWSTGCINQLILALDCLGGVIQFTVTYFLSGTCPSGQYQTCQSPGHAPFGLTLVDYTCEPFMLHYQVTSADCPLVRGSGYSSFVVTE